MMGVEVVANEGLRRMVTTSEAAHLLRQRPETIRRKLRTGEIHGIRIGDGPRAPWRILPHELRRITSGGVPS